MEGWMANILSATQILDMIVDGALLRQDNMLFVT